MRTPLATLAGRGVSPQTFPELGCRGRRDLCPVVQGSQQSAICGIEDLFRWGPGSRDFPSYPQRVPGYAKGAPQIHKLGDYLELFPYFPELSPVIPEKGATGARIGSGFVQQI